MKHVLQGSLSLSTFCLLALSAARAQTVELMVTQPEPAAMAPAYWTPERFKTARPIPEAIGETQPVAEVAKRIDERAEWQDGRAPTYPRRISPRLLHTPGPAASVVSKDAQVRTPHAVGTGHYKGGHYTSTRVFPMFTGANAHFSADRAYPYITVGKLFFSVNGVPSYCSGATIQRRIVVTAGSCVHRGYGGNTGFHKDFVFVPAHRDGTAPLMLWNWNAAVVHTAWANGGGDAKNPANYAMLEFADQRPPTGGAPLALGSVTGWLGWQTYSLNDSHTSKLGYAGNLDNGEKMQNVMSSTYLGSVPNLLWDGSDARHGSEGSPWVQNFQVLQVGGGSGGESGVEPRRWRDCELFPVPQPNPKSVGAR